MGIIALEVYFWAMLGLAVGSGVAALLGWKHPMMDPPDTPSTPAETMVVTLLGIVALAPLYYLQSVSFGALQFPVWVVWVEALLMAVYVFASVRRRINTLDRPSPVYLVPFVIAWHGLQVVKSAADFGLV